MQVLPRVMAMVLRAIASLTSRSASSRKQHRESSVE
jgi:hypothetical protein